MNEGVQSEILNMGTNGCYFLSLLEWACRDSMLAYDWADIQLWAQKALIKGFLTADLTVKDPVQIYNMVSRGRKYSTVTVADKPAETCIVCNEKPGYRHFTLRYKGNTWDPLDPKRKAASQYKPTSYRVLS